jgi:hypothetical protein
MPVAAAIPDQPALFDHESESAIFLSVDELSKRYTSEQALAVDWKRRAVVLLLATGMPAEVIARELNMSTRTVGAVAAKCSEKVAGSRKEFAGFLMEKGGRWFGLAQAKESEATFLNLVMAGSLAVQRAAELQLTSEVEGENVLQCDDDKSGTRDKVLRFLNERGLVTAASQPADGASDVNTDETHAGVEQAGVGVSLGVCVEVVTTTTDDNLGPTPKAAAGRGGGSEGESPLRGSTPASARGISAVESPGKEGTRA